MQTLQNGYQGLGLLLLLNWDRILVLAAIVAALAASAHLRSL